MNTSTSGGDKARRASSASHRRVDCVAHLAHGIPLQDAIALLRHEVAQIPNVLRSPPPDIEILESTAEGTRLSVRPYCQADHYWQVLFDLNHVIVEVFKGAGCAAPTTTVSNIGPD